MAGMIMPVVEKVGLQLLLEPQASGLVFRAACNTVGVVYPAYASFKTIESKDKASDQQWLTYWVIYSLLSLGEGCTDELLSRFPYYYHGKFLLLLWLQLPGTQGAKLLYHRYLRPSLLRFQPKIDVVVDKLGTTIMALYHLYKVPIDALGALLLMGYTQATQFVRWFFDSSPSSSGSISPNSQPPVTAGPAPGYQFLVR